MLNRQPLLSHEERVALLKPLDEPMSLYKPIRVVCADPQPMMLEGLKQSFKNDSAITLERMLTDGANAWREVMVSHPDILVTEMNMGGLDGIDLIRWLKKNGWPTKVVVFTLATNPKWPEAWAEGVQGLVSKTSPKETLMKCIRAVSAGDRWLDESLWLSSKDPHNGSLNRLDSASRLTAREIIIVKALMKGCSKRDIAKEMAIEEEAVTVHLKHIHQKTGYTHRDQLVFKSSTRA